MDDDVKTLLAIVALVYGSSLGIGLVKDALDPVKEKTNKLDERIGDPRFINVIGDDALQLRKSLWSRFVVLYVLMVLLVPTFLFIVVLRGPATVLRAIGLASSSTQTASTRPSIFYLILFGFSLVATAYYLSKYFKGWLVFIKYLRSKTPGEAPGG